MYRAILRVQWLTTAPLILLGTLLAFILPISQIVLTGISSLAGAPEDAMSMLSQQEGIHVLYPMLALSGGALLAALSWQDDTLAKHVYSLILPVPRWYYLLLRMAGGLTLLAIPVVALWIAALLAASQVTLPLGLHAYPTGLAVRFAFCCAIAYTLVFTIHAASRRTRIILAGVFFGVVTIAGIIAMLGYEQEVAPFMERLFRLPALGDAFFSRWRIIDV